MLLSRHFNAQSWLHHITPIPLWIPCSHPFIIMLHGGFGTSTKWIFLGRLLYARRIKDVQEAALPLSSTRLTSTWRKAPYALSGSQQWDFGLCRPILDFPSKDAGILKAEVGTWMVKALCLEMDEGWGSRSVMQSLYLCILGISSFHCAQCLESAVGGQAHLHRDD